MVRIDTAATMDARALATSPVQAASSSSSGSASPASTISSLINVIHDEASQAKLSTDSAIVLESSTASSSSNAVPLLASLDSSDMVQSPAPSTQDDASHVLLHALLDTTRILKPIANGLRSDQEHRLRHSLGSSQYLPTAAVQLLKILQDISKTRSSSSGGSPLSSDSLLLQDALQDAQLHLLRLLANLCIDSAANRAVLFGVAAPQAVIDLLASILTMPASSLRGPAVSSSSSSSRAIAHPSGQLPLLRTAVGALLNMQLAHEPTRAALRAYSSTIAVLAHLAYNPAIYPLNAVSALLAPSEPSSSKTSSGGEFGLAISGLSNIDDGDDALEELQVRASIASWASQVLTDIISDRTQPGASEEAGEAAAGTTEGGVGDISSGALTAGSTSGSRPSSEPGEAMDEDEDENDEPQGEINAEVVASHVPLSALVLPLAAFLSGPITSAGPPSASASSPTTSALARALADDEDARLTLVSTDVELLQNAVQMLEKAVLDAGVPDEPETPNPALEVTASQANGGRESTIRRRMLERAELGRAPWAASTEAPALSRWLVSLAQSLSPPSSSSSTGNASGGEDSGSASTTPTGGIVPPTQQDGGAEDPSRHKVSSACTLALLMNFLQRGHAPLLAAAAQRSASSTSSSLSSSSTPGAAAAAPTPALPLVTPALAEGTTSAGALLRAAAQSFVRCKSGLARVLVEVVGDDACMEALFVSGSSFSSSDAPPSSSSGSGLSPAVPLPAAVAAVREAEGVGAGPASASGLRSEAGSGAPLGSGWFVDTLKRWMKTEEEGGVLDEELQSTALLAMGNLARKDSHCTALVQQHSLAPFLVSLLPTSSSTASTTAASRRLSHGVLSLLKNLSIPETNKPLIGQLGVISRVTDAGFLGKENIQQVQFAAVGLLKHLCRGESACAVEVVLGPGPATGGEASSTSNSPTALDALLNLIAQTDDVPVRMEGTRVLVYVVKALWSSSASTSSPAAATAANFSAAPQSIATAKATLSTGSPQAHAVRLALARMVRTAGRYPVLVNEGVVALTLLATENAESAEGVAEALLQESGSSGSSSGGAGGAGVTAGGGSGASVDSQVVPTAVVASQQPIAPVIMAEPESFEPPTAPSASSTTTDADAVLASAAPSASALPESSRAPRAGPLSNLLRTETANAPDPGNRRQSTSDAYVQAGLASGSTSQLPALQTHGRSPLASGGGASRMDVDSPVTPASNATVGPQGQPVAPSAVSAAPPRPPQMRRSDTTPHQPPTSGSTLLTAPRPSAISMLDVVLGRRDARMPPHFASNAAVLVQMVVSRSEVGKGAGVEIARRTRGALDRLVAEGPEEAQGAAKEALGVVSARLEQVGTASA
ncbi:hypothetical protein V8E36_004771 [Tilletia maclaganii]